MRTDQSDTVDLADPAGPARSIFLFVSCPSAVLESFERQVADMGAAPRVEPIAVSVYPSAEYFQAFLEDNRGDVRCVVVDLRDPDEAKDLIEIAARTVPDALVLATDDGQRSELVLPALRAGAKDVISPPYDMLPAVRTLGLEAPVEGASGARVAFFLPAQGGSGASTAAIHFAASIASELRGKEASSPGDASSVLLLDLDFHSDSAAFWLNKRPAYTLLDALGGAVPASSYWRKITTPWNGVDLLAPPPPDSYVSEKLLEALPKVLAAASATYSWVVADLPPTLFASSRRLLPRADLVFLVCTPEARSLYLARRRLADLKGLGINAESLRVTLNRAGAKRAIEAATAEKAIGCNVSFSIDNDYLEISSAYSDRRLASPHSTPGKQFRNMARVALGVSEAVPGRSSGWRRLVGFG